MTLEFKEGYKNLGEGINCIRKLFDQITVDVYSSVSRIIKKHVSVLTVETRYSMLLSNSFALEDESPCVEIV